MNDGGAAWAAAFDAAAAAEAVGSACMWLPRWSRLAKNRPITSAIDEITSKYTTARTPTRPARLISPAEAMPVTTVRNTSGATPALISARNMSPRNFSEAPKAGKAKPTAMPSAIATSTCMPSRRYHGVGGTAGPEADAGRASVNAATLVS